MSYNLTDGELAKLSNEQVLELSDANIRMSRRLDAEMVRRGLVISPEAGLAPRHARMREILAEQDASAADLHGKMLAEGLEVRRETVQRWLAADARAGLAQPPPRPRTSGRVLKWPSKWHAVRGEARHG